MRTVYATAAAAAILMAAAGVALADNGGGSGPPEEAEPGSAYQKSYPQLAGGPPLTQGDRWYDKGDYGDDAAYSPQPPPEEDMAPYDDQGPPPDQYGQGPASGPAHHYAPPPGQYAQGPEADAYPPGGPAHHYAPPPEQYAQGPDQPYGQAEEGYADESHGQAHGGQYGYGMSRGAHGGWRGYEHGPVVRRYAWKSGGMRGRSTVKTYSYDSGWVPTYGHGEGMGAGTAMGGMAMGGHRGCGHKCPMTSHGYSQPYGSHGGQSYAPPPPPPASAQGYDGGYDRYGGGQAYGDGGYDQGGYDQGMYGQGTYDQGPYGGGHGAGYESQYGDYHSFWKYRIGYQPAACGAELVASPCGGLTTAGLRISDMSLDGGVGPAWIGSGGGGGGFIVGGNGFGSSFSRARASASASAFASARARVHVSGGGKGHGGHHGGCCK
ncbi:MAG TPA: hypothetical protein VF559_12090 [Caulobacteraceae bacterium]|jgi:hypothetical protein